MFRHASMLIAMLAALSMGFVGCSKNKDKGSSGESGGSGSSKNEEGGSGGGASSGLLAKLMTVKLGDSIDDVKKTMGVRPTLQTSDTDGDTFSWIQGTASLAVKAKDGKVFFMAAAGGKPDTSADLSSKFDQVKVKMKEDEALKTMDLLPFTMSREKNESHYSWMDKAAMYQVHCKNHLVEMVLATPTKND